MAKIPSSAEEGVDATSRSQFVQAVALVWQKQMPTIWVASFACFVSDSMIGSSQSKRNGPRSPINLELT